MCVAGSLLHSLRCVTSFAVPWVCESGAIAGHGGTQQVQEEEPVGPPPTQCERFVHTVEYVSTTHHVSSAHPPLHAKVTAQGPKAV